MEPSELAALRAEYTSAGLTEADAGDDPFALLNRWLLEAVTAGIDEPNAMALATADGAGRPSVRTVLLKGLSADGAVFYTNLESRKASDLAANPRAAAALLWRPLQRQVRIEGPVALLSDAEADRYFASRPRGAQLGAVASRQSRPVADRDELERLYAEAEARAADSRVDRPAYWGGYRLAFESVEFWQGRPNRLHDRIRFTRDGSAWARERLQP